MYLSGVLADVIGNGDVFMWDMFIGVCFFLCFVHWSLRPLMLMEGAVPTCRDVPEPVPFLGNPAADLCPKLVVSDR